MATVFDDQSAELIEQTVLKVLSRRPRGQPDRRRPRRGGGNRTGVSSGGTAASHDNATKKITLGEIEIWPHKPDLSVDVTGNVIKRKWIHEYEPPEGHFAFYDDEYGDIDCTQLSDWTNP